jgi:hypothetical protein
VEHKGVTVALHGGGFVPNKTVRIFLLMQEVSACLAWHKHPQAIATGALGQREAIQIVSRRLVFVTCQTGRHLSHVVKG